MSELSTTKMSSKGQIVIPEEIRISMGLPHKDIIELCNAILKGNIDAIYVMLDKANHEEELEVNLNPATLSLGNMKK